MKISSKMTYYSIFLIILVYIDTEFFLPATMIKVRLSSIFLILSVIILKKLFLSMIKCIMFVQLKLRYKILTLNILAFATQDVIIILTILTLQKQMLNYVLCSNMEYKFCESLFTFWSHCRSFIA